MTNLNLTKDRAELMNTLTEILFKSIDGEELTIEDKVNYGLVFEKFRLGKLFDQCKEAVREGGANVSTDLGYVDVKRGSKISLDWSAFCKTQRQAGEKVKKAWMAEVEKEGPSFSKLLSYLSDEDRKEYGIRTTLDPSRDPYAVELDATAQVKFNPY